MGVACWLKKTLGQQPAGRPVVGGRKHSIDRTTSQQGVELSGNNLMLEAGNNLLAQASTLEAKGNAALQAGGELQLLTADNEVYHFEQSKSKGLLKSKSTENKTEGCDGAGDDHHCRWQREPGQSGGHDPQRQ
ncbi:hemagglutinin repeat-containing protein [Aeromonas bestiarum]|uniref:hemagglutinin repeat-containing protein n=1 Tax=Aeromonas bestiarum TaxID=105751 RepID=UPI003D1EC711